MVLPELPATTVQPADVTIRYGVTPEHLDQPTGRGVFYELTPRQCLLNLTTIAGARYLVEDGATITVERSPLADEAVVRIFLLGSALAALLYQRDSFPLHASAVLTPAGAVLFAGASGSGKSTLAAALTRHGYPLLCDDVCAIAPDAQGRLCAVPGLPQLKLWADAVQKIDGAAGPIAPLRPTQEKYHFGADSIAHDPALVVAFYELAPGNLDEIQIEPLAGMDKLAPIQNNAYRDLFALQMGKEELLFEHALWLARQCRVSRVQRPRHRFLLNELVASIEQDLA